jgi:hypothetical protein
MFGHGVAEQPAGEQIFDCGQVELALVGDDLGDVAAPQHVRRDRGEVPADLVGGGGPFALTGQRPAFPDRSAG